MFFKLVSLVMVSIAVLLGMSVDSDHAFSAILIPSAAAFGIAMLASD